MKTECFAVLIVSARLVEPEILLFYVCRDAENSHSLVRAKNSNTIDFACKEVTRF